MDADTQWNDVSQGQRAKLRIALPIALPVGPSGAWRVLTQRSDLGAPLTLTLCEGTPGTCHVQHWGLRTTGPGVSPDALALRRDRAAPARRCRSGHRIPVLPCLSARPAQPDPRSERPRHHLGAVA